MVEPLPLSRPPQENGDSHPHKMSPEEKRFYAIITLLGGTSIAILSVGLFAPFEDTPDHWYWGTGYIFLGLFGLAMTVFFLRSAKERRQEIGRSSQLGRFYVGAALFLVGVWPIAQWYSGGNDQPDYFVSGMLMVCGTAFSMSSFWPLHTNLIARIQERFLQEARRLTVIVFTFALTIFALNIYSLRSDFNIYVRPRSLSQGQAIDLQKYLKESYSVTVKVNGLDQEALQYAGQIYGVLRKTSWNVEFSTGDAAPQPGTGVTYFVIGDKPQPQGSKPTPRDLLQEAFNAAGIQMSGGGGQAAGDYKLYLLIGHRPLEVGQRLPLLFWIGSWIAHRGLPGAPV